MTLADEGWIRNVAEPPTRWELTTHIFAVALTAQGGSDLRQRVRPTLERLRDETGETVLFVVPDLKNFVITDVIECRQALRMVPHVGTPIAPQNSAAGRAMLAFMDIDQQTSLLGAEPSQQLLESFELTRRRGYAISDGEIDPTTTTIAAPIFKFDGTPGYAIVVCAPRERLIPPLHETIGKMVAQAARELSQGATATPKLAG